ncbi:MAG: zinc-ribbon domain-containing protein, partial [Magnetococcales bacterium]|nr:zinc-ribbon domain-containing protein [Magnetococcales bacterium]
MVVQCPQCRSRFKVPDQLSNTGKRRFKLKCSRCQHLFVHQLPVLAVVEETPPIPSVVVAEAEAVVAVVPPIEPAAIEPPPAIEP